MQTVNNVCNCAVSRICVLCLCPIVIFPSRGVNIATMPKIKSTIPVVVFVFIDRIDSSVCKSWAVPGYAHAQGRYAKSSYTLPFLPILSWAFLRMDPVNVPAKYWNTGNGHNPPDKSPLSAQRSHIRLAMCYVLIFNTGYTAPYFIVM